MQAWQTYGIFHCSPTHRHLASKIRACAPWHAYLLAPDPQVQAGSCVHIFLQNFEEVEQACTPFGTKATIIHFSRKEYEQDWARGFQKKW
eukprot:1161047-Pelagomonas_calceolata.AAC.42